VSVFTTPVGQSVVSEQGVLKTELSTIGLEKPMPQLVVSDQPQLAQWTRSRDARSGWGHRRASATTTDVLLVVSRI